MRAVFDMTTALDRAPCLRERPAWRVRRIALADFGAVTRAHLLEMNEERVRKNSCPRGAGIMGLEIVCNV